VGKGVFEFVKKYKERVTLVGIGLAFFLFVAIGSYLQEKSKLTVELPVPTAPQAVEIKAKPEGREQGGQVPGTATAPATAYFLHPSPEELLAQVASLDNLNDAAVDAKYLQLPVLWPAYFFAFRETGEGKKTLLLDVSEDGFGAGIESEVDPALYPQLRKLNRGEKLWIGGKILAIDRTGLGTIYLQAEQIRVGAEPPFPAAAQQKAE
jgi:hypothetical protein